MKLLAMQLLIVLLCAACPLGAGTAAERPDRGVFHISVNGREVGTETFEIAPGGDGVRATAELQMSVEGVGRMTETATLQLRANLEPARYERIQKSPKHGSAILTFGPEKTAARYRTSEGGVQDMEFYVSKDVVVLDTNFFHHYTFLARHYDFARGGIQHVNVLIPQEATPGMVKVESAGNDQSLRKLVARTDELEIDIWLNDAGQVMKLSVPAAKVEVMREVK